MTRINLGIDPSELTDQHLLAEHREIKRVCSTYKTWVKNGRKTKIPESFRLGTGHVMYFVDKPRLTLRRYDEIHAECLNRGFNVTDFSELWNCYSIADIMNSIVIEDISAADSFIARQLVRYRIAKNIIKSKQVPRYYSEKISKAKAILLIK